MSPDVDQTTRLPLPMLVQWVYCPRLFFLMHVEGQMEANEHVWKGRVRHRRVDAKTDRATRRKVAAERDEPDAPPEPPESWRSHTSMDLGSDGQGLVGRLDTALLSDGGRAIPAEMKSGAGPDPERHGGDAVAQGAWLPDAVHVAAQAMLLEEAGLVARARVHSADPPPPPSPHPAPASARPRPHRPRPPSRIPALVTRSCISGCCDAVPRGVPRTRSSSPRSPATAGFWSRLTTG